jgi:hypothetical protein
VTEALAKALNELVAVNLEATKLGSALSEIRGRPQSLEGAMGWLAVQGLASAVEKIYGGCERIMLALAKNVDSKPVEADEGWHRSLLHRMSNPFGSTRPALLSTRTFAELEKLRSFRHRERNSYGSALIVERVLELAADAILAPQLLEADLKQLAEFLEDKALKQ